jgi:hypothetical protein
MVRLYSPKLVALVNQDNGKYSLGIDLAKHCIEAGLNATYVAEILETSRMTVHAWFRGGTIRPNTRPKIEVFIDILEEDTRRGLLPVNTLAQAKAYAEDILGRPLKSSSLKASD